MSKDFEQAYKELAQIEVPDLWDRIEAELSKKSTPAAFMIDSAPIAAKMDITDKRKKCEKEAIEKQGRRKSRMIAFSRKYAVVAAALVCVAILIPAISLVGEFGIGGSKSADMAKEMQEFQMAAEEAPAEMMPESTQETEESTEAESMEEDCVVEESIIEEKADVTESAVYAEEGNAVKDQMTYVADEATYGGDTEAANKSMKEAAMAESAESGENADSAAAEKISGAGNVSIEEAERVRETLLTDRCPEGTRIESVQIKVVEISKMQKFFESSKQEAFGCICRAEVQKSQDDFLYEGEQIDIFMSAYSSKALLKDGVYQLNLNSFIVEETCYFTITE